MRTLAVRAALLVFACLIVPAAIATAQSWPDPAVGGGAHPIIGDPVGPTPPPMAWTANVFIALDTGTTQYAVSNATWIRTLAIRAAARLAPLPGPAVGRSARTYRATPAARR